MNLSNGPAYMAICTELHANPYRTRWNKASTSCLKSTYKERERSKRNSRMESIFLSFHRHLMSCERVCNHGQETRRKKSNAGSKKPKKRYGAIASTITSSEMTI